MNENYFFRIGDYLFVTYPENVRIVNRNRRNIGVAETFDDLVKKSGMATTDRKTVLDNGYN